MIGLLGTQYRLIAEMKYKDKLSLEKIGFNLNMDKSTVSRTRERIVEDISKLLKIIKRCNKIATKPQGIY